MHRHKWTNWSGPYAVDSHRYVKGHFNNDAFPFKEVRQDRRCKTCQLVEQRVIGLPQIIFEAPSVTQPKED